MSMQASGLYEFGLYRLDAAQRLLTRAGEGITLAPKTFDLLLILVVSRGSILTKKDLMSALWPDTFVEEANLPFQVSGLRKALGDDGAHWIETLPKHGYRFNAPVTQIDSDKVSPGPADQSGSSVESPSAHSRQPRQILPWLIAGVVTLLAIAVAVPYFRQEGKSSKTSFTAIPLTSYRGSERQPTFSPDGNQVAFSWNGPEQRNFDIYVKVIGAESPLRLTTDPAMDFSPVWSPDGRSIAFLRSLPGDKTAVILIAPLGGPERKIGETRAVAPEDYFNRPLAWSPDSRYLAVMDNPAPAGPSALFLLSVDSGEERRLTQPPHGLVSDSDPAFSPDGRMLAFTRSPGLAIADVYVINLSAEFAPVGDPKRLTFDNRFAYSPAWTQDGRQIIFSSNRAVSGDTLWRIDADGGEPHRLEYVGEGARDPAISTKGNRLVYGRRSTDTNVWRIEAPDAGKQIGTSDPKKSLFIASSRRDNGARMSPDGGRIVFVSDRSGALEIWLCDSNGRNAVQLTKMGAFSASPRWSPDGAQIAFDSNLEGHFEVYVINVNGGRPRRLTSGAVDNSSPTWSIDGKWIYFIATRDGQRQVWKAPSGGGPSIPVTQKDGFSAQESLDGKFLYYMKRDYSYARNPSIGSLWRSPIGGGDEIRIVESLRARSFEVVEDGIYFTAPGQSGDTLLQFYTFATEKTTLIAVFQKPVGWYIDVSPDRRWIFYTQVDEAGGDLMLVEGFR